MSSSSGEYFGLENAPPRQRSSSKLDVPDTKTAPVAQVPRGVFRRAELYDQKLSGLLHRAEFGAGDAFVFVPAMLFSVYSFPIVLLLTFIAVPFSVWLQFLLSCITTLVLCLGFKHVAGRIRPGAHTLGHKRMNLRSLEKNNAMPSGDSAQAAVFSVLIALHFQQPLVLLLIPAAMFGRVYFGCHWIMDTVAGASLGTLVALTFHDVVPWVIQLLDATVLAPLKTP